jgi:hypothetical protein
VRDYRRGIFVSTHPLGAPTQASAGRCGQAEEGGEKEGQGEGANMIPVRRRAGFTKGELLVVVLVFGALIALIYFFFWSPAGPYQQYRQRHPDKPAVSPDRAQHLHARMEELNTYTSAS